jgi:hypothetical protein
MAPSATLVHTGLRTSTHVGWRAGVGQALATVTTTPSLWLLGALGFLLRGGIVLLTVPVLILPSPVAVRLLIGENLGSAGFTPAFYGLMALGAAVLVGLVLAGLLVAAYVELAAFERFLAARQEGEARPVPRLDASQRRQAVTGLLTVQLFALSALVAAAIPLVAGAAQVTYDELLRPSQATGSLYERVLGQLGAPLILLLAVLVLVEVASAVASRRLLRGAFGLTVGPSPLTALLVGLGRPVVRPLSTVGTALLGWSITLALLVPVVWAIGLAWQVTRSALLDPQALTGAGVGAAALAVVVLCAIWLGGIAVAGVAAALRAGLWSAEELR